MKDRLGDLAERIQAELHELDQVVGRVHEAWQRAQRNADDYYLDSVALNLHGFYTGLERIFTLVAETADGVIPTGENWHQALLAQMAKDVPTIRPAVISPTTCKRLNEYRGFRHIVRNVYTFHFDPPPKVEKLVQDVEITYDQAKLEILAFTRFLEKAS